MPEPKVYKKHTKSYIIPPKSYIKWKKGGRGPDPGPGPATFFSLYVGFRWFYVGIFTFLYIFGSVFVFYS